MPLIPIWEQPQQIQRYNVAKQTEAKLTPDEMKAALAAEQQSRITEAAEQIKAVCEKYRVQIVPRMILSQGSVVAELQIIPTE